MRKLGFNFLIIVFLVSNTQLVQLLKLPTLFFHFFEHRAENNQISFLLFLNNHYAHAHNDNDDNRDKQLPFMDFESIYNDLIAIEPLFKQKHDIELPITDIYLIYRPAYNLTTFHTSVWQPPQARFTT
jgi:hypothetical protein